jgi:hypothetical protein
MYSDDIQTRFWAKVDKSGSCWKWTASTLSAGYGQFTIARRRVLAHRVSWEIQNQREVPEGMCICHSCDNPRCVHPEHLFLGSLSDNMKDCYRKGRSNIREHQFKAGKEHPRYGSKLSQPEISLMRLLYRDKNMTQRQLALVFGVSKTTAGKYLKRG